MRTTKSQARYWQRRKIDWDEHYLRTWEHPHRYLITIALNTFEWRSLMEIGCGGGANLKNIIATLKGKQVGGIDINPDAIALCEKTFKGGVFRVGNADNLMMSDKSSDVLLADMTYIYVGPFKIGKHIKELRRVARKQIVLFEFHEKSWWKRILLYLKTGYFAHNWPKLLKKYGFYDIIVMKMPKEAWEPGLQTKYAYLIKAKSPLRY
jgi:ubiquinone/menaquinone biosynthesis C-methylase UbiE